MRGLCPIITDMARAVNLSHDDKEAMQKITNLDKKALAYRKMKVINNYYKER